MEAMVCLRRLQNVFHRSIRLVEGRIAEADRKTTEQFREAKADYGNQESNFDSRGFAGCCGERGTGRCKCRGTAHRGKSNSRVLQIRYMNKVRSFPMILRVYNLLL